MTWSRPVRIAGLVAPIVAALAVMTADAQSREKRLAPVDPAQRESFSKATNVAVVVGVSDYASDTGLQKLQYADRDAQAIAAELRRQNYTVRLLVNTEATRSRIVSAVREAGDVVTRDGTLLFYFSGHGFAPQAGRNYLATFGVTADELAQDGLSVDDLRQRIQQSPARRKVLFIDACRSEAGKGAGARSFASLTASSGLEMLLSTQMGRISYENDQLQQGVFTYFLLKALRGEAAGADGFVTFRDVSEYVTSSVRQWSFEKKQTQIPVVVSDEVTGDFLLAKSSLSPTPAVSAPPTTAVSSRPSAPPSRAPDNRPAQSGAPTRVGVLQAQAALLNTNDGKKASADLMAKFDPKRKELDQRASEIRALQARLQSGGSTMSEAAKGGLQREIDQKTKAYNREAEDAQADAQQEQKKVLDVLTQKMTKVVEKFAAANGYSLLLDVSNPNTPVLYASNSIETTADVTALYETISTGGSASGVASKGSVPVTIGVVHIQNAITSTRDGKRAVADLEAKVSPQRNDLELKASEIKALQARLQSGASTMSEAAKGGLQREIDQKTKAYNREMEDAQADTQQEQQKLLSVLGEKMMKVIEKYVSSNGYLLILDADSVNHPILYFDDSTDLTNDIVNAYDGGVPVPRPARTAKAGVCNIPIDDSNREAVSAAAKRFAQANGYSIVLDVNNSNTPVLYAANTLEITQGIKSLVH